MHSIIKSKPNQFARASPLRGDAPCGNAGQLIYSSRVLKMLCTYLKRQEMVNSTPSFPHELIGKEITITRADNHRLLGMTGKVVDETKFTLKVKHEGKTKILLKKNIVFRIGATGLVIEGKLIAKKPEERLKG